jgi:hypothetical protein
MVAPSFDGWMKTGTTRLQRGPPPLWASPAAVPASNLSCTRRGIWPAVLRCLMHKSYRRRRDTFGHCQFFCRKKSGAAANNCRQVACAPPSDLRPAYHRAAALRRGCALRSRARLSRAISANGPPTMIGRPRCGGAKGVVGDRSWGLHPRLPKAVAPRLRAETCDGSGVVRCGHGPWGLHPRLSMAVAPRLGTETYDACPPNADLRPPTSDLWPPTAGALAGDVRPG